MKAWPYILAALIVLPLLHGADERPSAQTDKLGFLAGTWQGDVWGGRFEAYYTTPEGGKVLSYNELVKDGKVVFHEFERFDESRGKLTFFPYPRGKPATPLTIARLEENRAVFENPKKDFPTRVDYHRKAVDRLVITLSDPHGPSDKVEVFDLKRVR